MDRRAVLTKTAKGLLEISGRTSLLGRDQRQLLGCVDGKVTVGDLQHLSGLRPARLQELLGQLLAEGYVRQIVAAPASRSPASQLDSRPGLDFSDLVSLPGEVQEAVQQVSTAAQQARDRRAAAAAEIQRKAAELARQTAQARRQRETGDRTSQAGDTSIPDAAPITAGGGEQLSHSHSAAPQSQSVASDSHSAPPRAEEAEAMPVADDVCQQAAAAPVEQATVTADTTETGSTPEPDLEPEAVEESGDVASQWEEERAEHAEAAAQRAREAWMDRQAREEEARQRRAAEAEARRQAEATARARALEEERTRALLEAERAARERRAQRAADKAAADARVAERQRERAREAMTVKHRLQHLRRPRVSVGRWALLGLTLGLLAMVVLPHVPLDTARFARQIEAALGVPVSLGHAAYAWTPRPVLRFSDLRIGAGQEVRVGEAIATPTFDSLLTEVPQWQNLRLQDVRLGPAGLEALLHSRLQAAGPSLRRVELQDLRIALPGAELPPLQGTLELGAADEAGQLRLHDRAESISLTLVPQGDGRAALELHALQLPIGHALSLQDVGAQGMLSAAGLTLSEFDGRFHEGVLKGQGEVRWAPHWSFNGELTANTVMAVRLAPAVEGRLQAAGTFDMQGTAWRGLWQSPQLQGDFKIEKGVVHGLDLPRSLHSGSIAAGMTSFHELKGRFTLEEGRLRLTAMRMQAGVMQARGHAELAGGEIVEGRLAAELRVPAGVVRADFGLAGTPRALQVRR